MILDSNKLPQNEVNLLTIIELMYRLLHSGDFIILELFVTFSTFCHVNVQIFVQGSVLELLNTIYSDLGANIRQKKTSFKKNGNVFPKKRFCGHF